MCVSVAVTTQGNRESDQRKATTGINQARCQDFLKGGYVHGCLMYIYVCISKQAHKTIGRSGGMLPQEIFRN